jgi:hypothetical protein
MLNNQTLAFTVFFVAELHKVVAASRLLNIADMRLSYHHGTKEMQVFFFVFLSTEEKMKKKYGHKHLQKYFFKHTLDWGSSHADLLVAIQTTLLQKRAVILCQERIDPDPEERED